MQGAELTEEERILGSARVLFPQLGILRCTEKDIERAAGVPPGTVEMLFGSVGLVFNALVHKEYEELIQGLRASVEAELDPVAKLQRLVRARLLHMWRIAELFTNTRNLIGQLQSFIEPERAIYSEKEAELIIGVLRHGRDDSRLVLDNPEIAARAIGARLNDLERPVLLGHHGSRPTQEVLEHITGMVLSGIRFAEPPPEK